VIPPELGCTFFMLMSETALLLRQSAVQKLAESR
jgi:hypothetical protein